MKRHVGLQIAFLNNSTKGVSCKLHIALLHQEQEIVTMVIYLKTAEFQIINHETECAALIFYFHLTIVLNGQCNAADSTTHTRCKLNAVILFDFFHLFSYLCVKKERLQKSHKVKWSGIKIKL